jgi:CRP-like cAMP-binding protein
MDKQLIDLLETYKSIPEEDQEMILSAFKPLSFDEGDYAFRGGQVCRHMFFVCSGILRIVSFNDKGTEVTHHFLKQGRFCTILGSFKEQTVTDDHIQASCKTRVLSISRAGLLALYQRLPYMETLIDRIIQEGLLEKVRLRNSYLGQDSLARYKLFLAQQPEIARHVSLGDIASYLGITQQSLSRLRRNLRF